MLKVQKNISSSSKMALDDDAEDGKFKCLRLSKGGGGASCLTVRSCL